jgi:hypothetical protein
LRDEDYEALSQKNATVTDEDMEMATLRTRFDAVNSRVEQLLDSLETCSDKQQEQLITKRIGVRARERAELESQVKDLEAARGAAKAATALLGDAREELRAILASKDEEARLRLRAEVRRLVARIDLFPDGQTDLKVEEVKNLPTGPCFKVTFVNDVTRWVLCHSKKPSSAYPLLLDYDDKVPAIGDDEHALDAEAWLQAKERGELMPESLIGQDLCQPKPIEKRKSTKLPTTELQIVQPATKHEEKKGPIPKQRRSHERVAGVEVIGRDKDGKPIPSKGLERIKATTRQNRPASPDAKLKIIVTHDDGTPLCKEELERIQPRVPQGGPASQPETRAQLDMSLTAEPPPK